MIIIKNPKRNQMKTMVDVSTSFKTDRVRSSDILHNLTDKTENVTWYAKRYGLSLAPCPKFEEILRKYRRM
jgi:hypothetical protein